MIRNKCAACYRQYNRMEHLVEHMKVNYHSVHEPRCGVCSKHCRSFESLREHLIGPLPKVECARVFSVRGCSICLNIFDSNATVRYHRAACQYTRAAPMPRGGITGRAVALACKMVGGGSDGSVDLCARVCLIGEDENIIFQTYVKPTAPVTNYRYEVTGIRPEYLRDAMPLKVAQRRIQEILCNGEPLWKLRPGVMEGQRFWDTAKYPPLMKTSKLSNSLKYLTQAYLGYDIQTGIQDPYEDCVAAMSLYIRMRSQAHPRDYNSGSGEAQNNYPAWRQRELERMSPEELLALSASDYYCWCLDY
ncbi:RNA exonuclease 4-like [Panicum miliaceum]|uniref:RNA exonuclease 4-like n=1 Tax=Panicum miliaceum TaxID=4540 RepID=A0A3L6RSZ1_PANMI|nr:RNA exonuclease 4-like [Panicum miliaceum]